MTLARRLLFATLGAGICLIVPISANPMLEQTLSSEPDIGQKTQVTSERTLETTPSWSRDGSAMVFTSDRFGGVGICRIARSGGGGVAAITQPALGEVDVYPDVSPTADDIVFASNRSRGILQIWSVSLGSRGLTQLTNTPFGANYPAWSPDGKTIAYTAWDRNRIEYIWLIDADGANQRQLTEGTQPRWSPDGKKLVFSGFTLGRNRNRDIYTIDLETNTRTQITSETTAEFQPDWSRDGRFIAFVSYRGQIRVLRSGVEVIRDLRTRANYEIWIKNVQSTGTSSVQLTRSKGFDGWPRWAPKANEMAFVSDRGGTLDLWTLVPGNR